MITSESSNAMRFVFVAVGTHGDVLPPLAIAAELARRGTECHLVADHRFESSARARGIGFSSFTPHGGGASASEGLIFSGHEVVREALQQGDAWQNGDRARRTLFISLSAYCPTNLFCEAYGYPAVRLHLAPYHFPSLVAPPWPQRSELEGPLKHTYANYTLPNELQRFAADPHRLATINQHRASFGLAPVQSCVLDEPWVARHIALFPGWFCPKAADWPHETELLGFPLAASGGCLGAGLESWLSRRERPLVFTPGTAPNVQVEHFFEQAQLCCETLGLPGVFLSPRLAAEAADGSENIVRLPYLDLDVLLPRAALIVHHGGIGTTARALQAGIPQIISPLVYDQPDNAERVQRLGVGRRIERRSFSGRLLAGTARELLGDVSVGARLNGIRDELAGDSCISRCADLLMGELARRARGPFAAAMPTSPADHRVDGARALH
jgi:rhamnosyltransferase subunit B